eukprot:1192595-Prymnesium_polylepis.2
MLPNCLSHHVKDSSTGRHLADLAHYARDQPGFSRGENAQDKARGYLNFALGHAPWVPFRNPACVSRVIVREHHGRAVRAAVGAQH